MQIKIIKITQSCNQLSLSDQIDSTLHIFDIWQKLDIY